MQLADESNTAEDDHGQLEATRSSLLKLANIEHQLCRDGFYAILDIDDNAIWVFTLAEAKRKSLNTRIEDFQLQGKPPDDSYHERQLISATAASTGILSTWDLDGSSLGSRRPSGIPGLTSSNLDAFNANSAVPAIEATSTSRQKDVIYNHLTQAISHYLATSFRDTSGWLLYGTCACIRELSLGLNTVDSLPDTQIATFKTRWHPHGSLLVQVVRTNITKLYRVSQVYEMNHSLQVGDSLLILPSVAHGIFLSIEPRPKSRQRRSHIRAMEDLIKGELEDLCLPLTEPAFWIRVGFDGVGDSEHGIGDTYTLWPAQYCICKPPYDLSDPFREDSGAIDPTSDPIQRAKEWYDQRFERAKASEREKHRLEQEVQEAKRKQTKEHQEATQTLSPLDHRGDIQDGSGVYPTPPDAPPSQNHDTPNPPGTHASSEVGGIEGSFTNTPYNFNQEQDDLFGDHDIDLTEADFDFFDEPSPGQNEEGINQVSLAKDRSVLHLDAPLEAKDTPLGFPDATPSPGKTGGNDTERTQMRSDDLQESLETPTLAQAKLSSPSARDIGSRSVAVVPRYDNEANQDDPLATSIERSNNAGDIRALQPINGDIDTKYSSQGRFAFPVERIPSKEGAVKEAHQTPAGIPQLGLLDGSASDTEESLQQGLPAVTSLETYANNRTDTSETPGNSSTDDPMEVDDDPLMGVPQPRISIRDEHEQVVDSCVLPPLRYMVASTDSQRSDVPFPGGEPPSKWSVPDEKLLIQVAQLVIDHAIGRQPSLCKDPELSGCNPFLYYDTASKFLEMIRDFMLGALPHSCIRTLIEVAQPRAEPGNKGHSHNNALPIQLLDHPYTLIKRIDTNMDILPSALSFWEDLGLQPASGSKDILGFCVAPNLSNSKHLWRPIRTFLEMMTDAYQACNLGSHEIVKHQDGEYDPALTGGYGRIGSALSQLGDSERTLVAYMLDDGSRMLPEICAQSLELLKTYRDSRRKLGGRKLSDVVIQVIPQKLVFSSHHLVVPTLDVYKSLAFELYNKCGPIDRESRSPPYTCAPAVSLSRLLPDKIDFKLDTNPAAATLYDDNRIHVAYCFDPQNEWITTSWTDNLGTLQWNAAYCNGMNSDDPWEPFKRLAREIVETTLEMLQPQSRTWRVFIAKVGQLLKQELKAWQSVLSSLKSPIREYSILSVDDDADLETALIMDRTVGLSETVDYLTTPVQTPSATGHSPEASLPIPGSSGTGFSQDQENRLIDVRDETWIFQPKHSIDDPFRTTDLCKAQASGYLLKRHDKADQDGLDALAVMLIHHEERQSNAILREVLEMYHKLSVLARVRNPAQAVKALLPLHVAAARTGHAAVSSMMRRD